MKIYFSNLPTNVCPLSTADWLATVVAAASSAAAVSSAATLIYIGATFVAVFILFADEPSCVVACVLTVCIVADAAATGAVVGWALAVLVVEAVTCDLDCFGFDDLAAAGGCAFFVCCSSVGTSAGCVVVVAGDTGTVVDGADTGFSLCCCNCRSWS